MNGQRRPYTARRCRPCRAERQRRYRAACRRDDPAATLLHAARARAKRAGVPCTITRADIRVPARCPVLGIPFAPPHARQAASDASPTIDRLDPSRGYVPGNVAVISHRANRIKSDGAASEHLQIAQWMQRALAKNIKGH